MHAMSNVTNVILIATLDDEEVVQPFTKYDHEDKRAWHGALGCVTDPGDVWVGDGKATCGSARSITSTVLHFSKT
jgi:hypothetical protein